MGYRYDLPTTYMFGSSQKRLSSCNCARRITGLCAIGYQFVIKNDDCLPLSCNIGALALAKFSLGAVVSLIVGCEFR